ncbi:MULTISPECIES: hypothetical protein [Pseudomonas]|uniref:Uncharacterized protein n=1 Tax=Pseudomonas fluorescens TaxID=294 RepID=A0A166N0U2_PSEFL|nr:MULTISPECIES: hypothetical protein [Pseudomonas]KZN16549.1 hypothetical protein A1D17_10395 [Pseudomonas fluorescens]
MLDYLLAEKNFVSLKQYVDLLNDLPDVLAKIENFSDAFKRSGHSMLQPPNAQALIRSARANAANWQLILCTMPQLGELTARVAMDIDSFSQEFRQMAEDSAKRKLPLSAVDPGQFSVVKSSEWGGAPPADLIDVMRELWSRLERCKQTVAQFKSTIRNVGETVHGIFVRFIESLSLPICVCHGVNTKIEVYYGLGRIGLPNMQYDPDEHYSEQQRLEMARDHFARLVGLYRGTGGAVNNLSDFCYRLTYILDEAGRELATSHPAQTVSRAKYSLSLVDHSILEVKSMSEQLIQMSKQQK